MTSTLQNIEKIKENMEAGIKKYGAKPAPLPKIIAVSKTHAAERIVPLLDGGHKLFGESRVQEAKQKWPELKEKYKDVRLHLIGPLQTNKVKEAVALFDVIESLDRESLARELLKEKKKSGKCPDLLVQVNTGEESQKSGIKPLEADKFIDLCKNELGLPVKGVMCIPPAGEEPAPHFALLRTIAERNNLPVISMGMSGDYEIATALGATHVRIGSAIFGERA